MNKLTMAHEYALKMLENLNPMQMEKPTRDGIVHECFELADAMQAEADKRNNKETCDKNIGLDSSVLKPSNSMGLEWQPDWSQAPSWANWWAMDMDKNCYWYEDELHLGDVEWDRHSIGRSLKSKPYGYTGNWQNSLRKRPQ